MSTVDTVQRPLTWNVESGPLQGKEVPWSTVRAALAKGIEQRQSWALNPEVRSHVEAQDSYREAVRFDQAIHASPGALEAFEKVLTGIVAPYLLKESRAND